MSGQRRARWSALALPLLVTLALVVLSLAGCGGSPASTSSAAATCSSRPSATAVVWDADGQAQGSLNGAPPVTLSSFSYPLGLPGESADVPATLGALAVAPDAAHLAVAVLVPSARGPATVYPYLVDTSTHAVTRVVLPHYPSALGQTGRPFAWADAHTLIVFAGVGDGSETTWGPATYSYNLATGAATALHGLAGAVEGEVRCSTIFWLGLSSLSSIGQAVGGTIYRGQVELYRYSLARHELVGQPISLGDTGASLGGLWGVDWPGWDVSADGRLVVYQQMGISFDGEREAITSTFRESNADGSESRIIFAGPQTVLLAGSARLAISPDGRQVAMTESTGDPGAVSGSFPGVGAFKAYSPAGVGQPAWLPDGSGFVAAAHAHPSFSAGIYQYWPGTPALGQNGTIPGVQLSQGGTNPATLI